ncbi:hypothetical protein [Leptospira yanagawae]|nr:hypothetical protein [Leptospira yanagawae]
MIPIITERWIQETNPIRIYLFGSSTQVKESSTVPNDLDFLLVYDTIPNNRDLRIRLHSLIADLGVPVDCFVVENSKIKNEIFSANDIVGSALNTGILIYESK